MRHTGQQLRTVVAGGVALLAAAAGCSRPAPAAADDALQADLRAAEVASTARAPRTQFVSAVELGREAAPRTGETAAPRRAAAPTRAALPERAARPVARVRRSPAPEAAPAPAPAPVAAAPAEPARTREIDDVPVAEAPARPVDEPVVAAPSRRPQPAPAGRGRGRVWDMGDVIRNAPFPINP